MKSTDIWPERLVPLGRMAREWMDSEDVEQVTEALGISSLSINPTVVDRHGTFRLLALLPIGIDGLGSGNSLFVRVTEERQQGATMAILLAVIERYDEEPLETAKILPHRAAAILDEMVRKLERATNLVSTRIPGDL
jgi:hypothetical protein